MNGFWFGFPRQFDGPTTVAAADLLEPSAFTGLESPEGALLLAVGTAVLGSAALGFLPDHGQLVVDTGDRSPIISLCIGVPGVAALLSLLYLGLLLSTSSIGIFFAIPVVAFSLTVLAGWTATGLVTLAGHLLARLGIDAIWIRVLVAGVLGGTLAFSVPVGVLVYVLGSTLGVGSGVRVLFNGGSPSEPDKRSIPPANKI